MNLEFVTFLRAGKGVRPNFESGEKKGKSPFSGPGRDPSDRRGNCPGPMGEGKSTCLTRLRRS